MSPIRRPIPATFLALAFATGLGLLFARGIGAQGVPQTWTIEDVASSGDTIGNSIVVPNGLGFNPLGRLVAAWGYRCACGGSEQETWARRDSGAWQLTPFTPFPEGSDARAWNDTHAVALGTTGKPYMVFDSRYAGGGHPDAIWSFKSDLNADPTGAAPGLFGYVSGINHWSDIENGQYAVAPAPDGTVRSARFTFSFPRIILNGGVIKDGFYWLGGGDYTVTPDGVDHIVYGSSGFAAASEVHYLRHDADATTEASLRGGAWESAIASDASGGLHAFIRTAESNTGNLEYRASIDSGATWSATEVVDSSGSAMRPFAMVDRNGAPAVAYWRWGQGLFFATREGGSWQTSLIYVPTGWNVRMSTLQLRLAFDAANQPHILFWDWQSAMMRLAMLPNPEPPPTNHPPVATDDVATTDENTMVRVPVLLNDTDADADDLRVTAVTAGAHGTTAMNADLTVQYTPSPGFYGTDTFTYTVDDGHGGTATATVRVTVNPSPIDLLTTTTLTSSVSPSTSGQAVTFTATVATVGAGATPAGTVSFVYVPTNTELATMPLVGGAAVFTTSGLPEGTFSVRAIFNGNSSFAGSTATLTQVVAPLTSTPIRNGELESRSQFSGVGMILASATHGACTATLIGPFTILTAAQCLTDSSPDPVFEFSLGEGRTARVTDIRVNPSFSTPDGINLAFDVALANIDRTVAATWTDIIPAALRADPVTPAVDATAIGFGETSAGAGSGRRTSGTLLITQYVAGADPDGNIQPVAFLEAVSESANQMFCHAGTGGPLVYQDQVVGVASFRFVATCAEDGPGYYVAVGNLAAWIQATVNVLTTPPTVTVPAAIVAEATGPAGAVATFTASASDIVGGITPTTCAPASGSMFPIGTTTVSCSSTDTYGNTGTRTFSVTVRDTTPPTLTLPADITTIAAPPGTTVPVSWTASASDAVDGAVPVTCAPASGSSFPVGTTTVSCAATDHSHNTQTGTLRVTVPPGAPANRAPTVVNPAPQLSYLGDEITLPIIANDPDGDALVFFAPPRPPAGQVQFLAVPGLRLDRSTGVISGITNTPGTWSVTVSVTDGHGHTSTVTFSWTVVNHGHPVVTTPPRQVSLVGLLDTLQIQAHTVPTGGALTYSAAGLPAGFSIDAGSGLISGTAVAGDIGKERLVTVTVTDELGLTASAAFRWVVIAANQLDLEVDISTLGLNGGRYAITFRNLGPFPTTPAFIRISTTALNAAFDCVDSRSPSQHQARGTQTTGTIAFSAGLGLGATLKCTSQSAGQGDVVAAVTATGPRPDGYLPNNIDILHFPIGAPSATNHPPAVQAIAAQDNIAGDAAALAVVAADADGDSLGYGLVSGKLPDGLSIDALTGNIGTRIQENAGGDFTATIAVTDGQVTALRQVVWHVTARTISLADPGPQDDAVGRNVRVDLQVSDRNNLPFTVTATGLPNGLTVQSSVDGRSWWIGGQPLASGLGTHTVTLTASSVGPSISRTFTWTIGLDVGPTLLNPGPQTSGGGQTVLLRLNATEPYGYPITFVLTTPLPPGVIWQSWGGFSGTIPFDVGGTYPITVTARSGSRTVSQSFVWTIIANSPPALLNPGQQTSTAGAYARLRLVATDDPGDVLTFGVNPTRPLPTGLTLNSTTGVIEGTISNGAPTASWVRVWVEDRFGLRSPEQVFEWRVNHAPTIGALPDRVDSVGETFNQSNGVVIQLGSLDFGPHTYVLTGLPPGITTPASGPVNGNLQLRGTLTTAGSWATTITITDSLGLSTTRSFQWLVMPSSATDVAVSGGNSPLPPGTSPPGAGEVRLVFDISNLGPNRTDGASVVIDTPSNLTGPGAGGIVLWSCQARVRNGGGTWRDAPNSTLAHWQSATLGPAGLTLTGLTLGAGHGIRCAMLPGAGGSWPTFAGASVTVTATANVPNEGNPANNSLALTRQR